MHEPLLARAACPAPTVVLGLLLRPFSLGHYVSMVSRGILTEKFELTVWQLHHAVLVCSQSWQQNQNPDERWLPWKLKIWDWRTRKMDLRRELEAFAGYLQGSILSFPLTEIVRVTGENKSSRAPGTPLVLMLQQWLMTQLGLPEHRAWDYPFGLAQMRWACHWEGEGGLNVYNEADREFDEFCAKKDAEEAAAVAAKQKGGPCPA